MSKNKFTKKKHINCCFNISLFCFICCLFKVANKLLGTLGNATIFFFLMVILFGFLSWGHEKGYLND